MHYFTMRYPGMKRKFMFENMTVHAIARASPDLYTHSHRKIAPAIRFSILLFFSLMKYRFDVIDSNEFPHFPNFAVKLYALLFPQTVFFSTWHEQWSFYYWTTYLGFVGGMIGYVLQILSAKMPSLIIAVSEHTRTDLVRFGAIKEDRLRVVSNGIDYESIKAAVSDYRPQKGTMVSVGRLIPEKRIDLLIELFRYMKRNDQSLKLTIVGGGPELSKLQASIKDDSIEFTGFIQSHLDVLKHVVGASVFVSMSEREGFNISALEACEMGVPTYVRLVCFKHPNLFELTSEIHQRYPPAIAGTFVSSNRID